MIYCRKSCTSCRNATDFYNSHIAHKIGKTDSVPVGYSGKRSQRSKKRAQSGLLFWLDKQWGNFLFHCYTKDVQASYYEVCKCALSENEAVMQVDFSENFQTLYQDNVQAAHWSSRQIILFSCVVWTASGVKSICMISDCLTRNKYTVHTVFWRKCFLT